MSTTVAEDLIAKLERRQAEEGLSNRQFSDKLGISSELWRLMRKGKRNVSQALARGVIRVYPEYKEDVLFILSSSVDTPTPSSDYPTTTSETHQSGSTGGFLGRAIERVRKWFKCLRKQKSEVKL